MECADDYWGVTVPFHVESDLGMKSILGDPSFYLKIEGDDLIGFMGVYDDDTLIAGNNRFEDVTKNFLQKFDSKRLVYGAFDFFACHISTLHHGQFLLAQPKHADNIPTIREDCEVNSFRSIRSIAKYLVHSKPYIYCTLHQASQETEKTLFALKIKELNFEIKESNSIGIARLKFGPLNKSASTILIYADAVFPCN